VGRYAVDTSVGPDRAVTQLVEHLSRSGVRTEVWDLDPAHTKMRQRMFGETLVFELPSRRRSAEIVSGIHPDVRAFVQDRRREIDLLHLHSVFTPHNVSIARASAKPYILSPRGGYSPAVLTGRHRWTKAAWMGLYERRFIGQAAAVHAVSEPEARRLVELTGHPRVVCIPNAVEAADQAIQTAPRRQGEERVLFIGRLAVQQKGLDLLLRGLAQSFRSDPPAIHLTMAGSDFRGGRAELEQLTRALSIAEHVTIHEPVYGRVKDEMLAGCHWFVHTSRWEGLPFAVLEALAAGRPVLLTPETNLTDQVHEYNAGIVVSGTPEGISDGLHRLAECDDSSYEGMREGARRLASEKFGWPAITRQMVGLYQQVLHHPSR
jgi:glycosyltransferase involved in cell wall biosynthesis